MFKINDSDIIKIALIEINKTFPSIVIHSTSVVNDYLYDNYIVNINIKDNHIETYFELLSRNSIFKYGYYHQTNTIQMIINKNKLFFHIRKEKINKIKNNG